MELASCRRRRLGRTCICFNTPSTAVCFCVPKASKIAIELFPTAIATFTKRARERRHWIYLVEKRLFWTVLVAKKVFCNKDSSTTFVKHCHLSFVVALLWQPMKSTRINRHGSVKHWSQPTPCWTVQARYITPPLQRKVDQLMKSAELDSCQKFSLHWMSYDWCLNCLHVALFSLEIKYCNTFKLDSEIRSVLGTAACPLRYRRITVRMLDSDKLTWKTREKKQDKALQRDASQAWLESRFWSEQNKTVRLPVFKELRWQPDL